MSTGRSIITAALRKLNAASANSAPSADEIDSGLTSLNVLIDSKSNSLLNIHTITPHTFPLSAGQYIYDLGPTGDWTTERPMRMEKAKLMTSPGRLPYPPTADFTASSLAIQPNTTVAFTNLSTDGTTYLWDFGDGTTSTLKNPSHTFVSSGIAPVTMTVTSAQGTATARKLITATALPTFTIRAGIDCQYYATYTAFFSGATFTNFSDYFDPLTAPPSVTFPTQPQATFAAASTGAIQGVWTNIGSDGFHWVWEYTIGALNGETAAVGYFTQAYGPAFDNTQYLGGPFSTFYASDGSAGGYGGTPTPGAYPTFTTGDVIGVVYDSYSSGMWFFKNGVNVASGIAVTTTGGTTLASLKV
jgi:hypothetical protein